MKKTKSIITNITLAGIALVLPLVGTFNITDFIARVTGWYIPSWMAYILAGMGVAAAIVTFVASCGAYLPSWAAELIQCMGSAAA